MHGREDMIFAWLHWSPIISNKLLIPFSTFVTSFSHLLLELIFRCSFLLAFSERYRSLMMKFGPFGKLRRFSRKGSRSWPHVREDEKWEYSDSPSWCTFVRALDESFSKFYRIDLWWKLVPSCWIWMYEDEDWRKPLDVSVSQWMSYLCHSYADSSQVECHWHLASFERRLTFSSRLFPSMFLSEWCKRWVLERNLTQFRFEMIFRLEWMPPQAEWQVREKHSSKLFTWSKATR